MVVGVPVRLMRRWAHFWPVQFRRLPGRIGFVDQSCCGWVVGDPDDLAQLLCT